MTKLFTVAKTAPISGVSTTGYRAHTISMPNKCITYNHETGEPLGVVGTDYQIMQPQECYDLVEKTCGSVENVRWDGKTMIMQGRMNSMLLPGDDEVNNMFTIINSFDGTSALHGLGISFRMFCSNQLGLAFSKATKSGNRYSIRHSGDWDSKVDAFREAFEGLAEGRFGFNQAVSTLVERKATSEDLNTLWQRVAPKVLGLTKTDLESKSAEVKINQFVNATIETYETERAMGCPDSLWLAGNAVTKGIQHSIAKRGRKADADRRFVDNAIGVRSNLSSYVMRTALELV